MKNQKKSKRNVMKIIILILLVILLISNNQLVLSGASYGLMLWYQNVLPLLLPFMIISGLIENTVTNSSTPKKTNSKLSSLTVVFLGIFCGYPIGAKTNAYFVKNNILSQYLGNILLPLCNNVSPMFFLGFILEKTLKNNTSILFAYAIIYLPYIIIFIIELLMQSFLSWKNNENNETIIKSADDNNKRSISEESITQITMVGLYIMICTVISAFIMNWSFITPDIKLLLIGITEITSGVNYVSQSLLINEQIKTALILGLTSFGGISSVMQTAKVIQGSGLSLLHYILIKIFCAVCTYLLFLLLI